MKQFIFTISISIIFISSCQKEVSVEQSTSGGSNSKAKIKSYNEKLTSSSENYSLTFNIGYDSKDRFNSMVSTSNSGDKFLYSYPSSSKYTLDLYNSGVLSIHVDFFLNNSSYIDSTFQFNDTQDTTTEKYLYNSSNQLVKVKEYIYSKLTGSNLDMTTDYTYDSNNNLIKTVDTDKNIHTYEYYSNLIYVWPLIRPINPGEDLKRRLIKKHTLISNGSLVGSIDYSYTFDAKDRVETIKGSYSDGRVFIKTFTYY